MTACHRRHDRRECEEFRKRIGWLLLKIADGQQDVDSGIWYLNSQPGTASKCPVELRWKVFRPGLVRLLLRQPRGRKEASLTSASELFIFTGI